MKWELVRHVNGRPWTQCQIAWYTLTEPTDFTGYGEYAADYWASTATPGKYPVYACRDCGRLWHSLSITIPGVIKSGSWWNKAQPGEPRTVHLTPRPYALAEAVAKGEAPDFELLPGVEARLEESGLYQFYLNGEKLQ